MSLRERLDRELNSIAGLPANGSPSPIVIQIETGTISVEAVSVDRLACAFNRLAFAASALEAADSEQIQRVSQDLAKRLSYLLEPISPIEIDAEACVVQMRSNPPQKDDDGTRFYELVVSRGELSLCRYAKGPGQPRQIVAAEVTREVLGRIASDFVDAAK